jgi:hypothetical protein
VSHQNPYDPQLTLAVEQSAGWKRSSPLLMLTTPFFLPLITPLSLFRQETAAFLWILAIVASIVWSIRTLWVMNGRPSDRLHLLCYAFAPVILCVFTGQSVAFVLGGLVLFLRLQPSRAVLAGFCLGMAATIKPHLFIVFGVALLSWSMMNRRYGVITGAVAAMAVLGTAATLFDPHCWVEYLAVMRAADVGDKILPNLSLLLRILIHPNSTWLQVVPCCLGSIWALWYVRHHRTDWDWTIHGAPLMMVSVMVAPYSWLFDEITLLPGVLRGIYMARRNGRSLRWLEAFGAIALGMIFGGVPINVFYFTWTPIAWLASYVYAIRSKASEVEPAAPLETARLGTEWR